MVESISAAAADDADGDPLGLFPLHAILLPGAAMAVRVFEPRYLRMVSDCGRHGRGFGVCLILEGEEAGEPALPATIGTEALIEDFGAGEDGLLTLRIRGARRFATQRIQVRDDGLQVADVAWFGADLAQPVRPEHGLLVTLLERLMEHVGGDHAKAPRGVLRRCRLGRLAARRTAAAAGDAAPASAPDERSGPQAGPSPDAAAGRVAGVTKNRSLCAPSVADSSRQILYRD